MSRTISHEIVSELFLTSNRDSNPNITSALGGQEAEDIVMEEREVRKSLLKSIEENDGLIDEAEPLLEVPDMWSWNYVGLYCQYASVGLLYGSSGTLLPFCVYNYDGASNVCANARNIVFFAWSFKVWFAMLTDSYRPFGLRRKPWMLMGWSLVLIMLLVLAIMGDQMNSSTWMLTLLFMQCFVMLSDVPADGYCVELGQLEKPEQRGQILATGQRIRFSFCMVAGVIQTFLLNGPTTNDPDCPTDAMDCWSWGLTVNQYYGLLLGIVALLTIPIFFLKELDNSRVPVHSWSHYFEGTCSLTNFVNNASITVQYYIIKLTNFQSGIDTITTYAALVLAVWIFQKYLINRNWRYTQFASTFIAAIMGLVWLVPFHNTGGLMDPWFTIFIDLDTQFVQGLAQVLYSMAVIELAVPGQEATTYELIVTVGNAALTLNGVISTQLLTPMDAVSCDDDTNGCSSNSVDITSKDAYFDSDGPTKFTNYTLLLLGISVGASFIFVPFLPASKEECKEWKEKGERLGASDTRGYIALVLAILVVGYGLAAAVLLINVDTSCQPAVGGDGC
eukprot:scaffold326_cov169-Ochromonas_danica.AAC.9